MFNEIPNYLDQPFLNKTIAPGEKFELGMGTLFPSSANYSVFPIAAFTHDNRELHHGCGGFIIPNKPNIPHLAIELLIGFTSGRQDKPDSCTTIPCGQISYPDR